MFSFGLTAAENVELISCYHAFGAKVEKKMHAHYPKVPMTKKWGGKRSLSMGKKGRHL